MRGRRRDGRGTLQEYRRPFRGFNPAQAAAIRPLALSFRHRGLRLLFESNSLRLLKPDLVERVRGILAALAMAETMEGFIRDAAPGWRVHRLSGARRYEWSVSVSGNWRITFEERNDGIERVNLEDNH